MIQEPQTDEAGPFPGARAVPQEGLGRQLVTMSGALWASPMRNTLLRLAAALCLVIGATAYGQMRLNTWNQPFYDALARRNFAQFLQQLGFFALIAGSLLALNVAQRWLSEMSKLKLREGLVEDLVLNWMVPGHAFRLASAGPIGVNPDQRMHEDARHLSELSADLGIGLLQASILLATFVNILWGLSANFIFHLGGRHFTIPGYMVWAALVYSGSASLLSYWVGRDLIDRNATRYAREADLRFSLVRINEHIDAITLSAGEAGEARRITADLAGVLFATRRLVSGLANLTWITAGYGWFTLVAPILVAAPLYFDGDLSFGGLMLASGAFLQVQSSLRWFVDNFSTIADWRATLLRVASFRRAVRSAATVHEGETRIAFEAGPAGRFEIENLQIASPSGCTMLKELKVDIAAGERILITGVPGAGKTLMFRALAGLWPWGSGRIVRPKSERIMYVPRAPYLPPGSPREVLAYPLAVTAFSAGAFEIALDRLDLAHLAPLLDQEQGWDGEMNDDERQSLSFARAVLHRPDWLIIDEVLDYLEDRTRDRIIDVLSSDLKNAGILYIGRAPARERFFSRTLHLEKDPKGRTLPRRDVHPGAEFSHA